MVSDKAVTRDEQHCRGPLHHRLKAMHHDEGRGRHRYARNVVGCRGARQGQGLTSAKAAVRQRPPHTSPTTSPNPCPRGSLSPYDPGQDRALAPALKNRILLENCYLPDALENQIKTFVADYNHRRYHESIANLLTLADVYFGRGQTIPLQRQTPDYRSTPLATPTACHITSSTKKGQSLTYLESSLSQKL